MNSHRMSAKLDATNCGSDRVGFVPRLLVGALAVFACFHFLMIGLLVAPLNPIRLQLNDLIASYTGSALQQTWTLFAPTPINDERGLLIRAVLEDPATGERTITQWTDISTSMVAASQRSRFFPPRDSRLVLNGLALLGWRDPYAERVRDRLTESGQLEPSSDVPALALSELQLVENASQMFARFTTLKATDVWGPNVIAVQPRIVVHKFPGFSERTSEELGEIQVIELEWLDADKED